MSGGTIQTAFKIQPTKLLTLGKNGIDGWIQTRVVEDSKSVASYRQKGPETLLALNWVLILWITNKSH